MLRQIRFLYDAEVKRLNPKSVQKAIKQMQNQLMTEGTYTTRTTVSQRACDIQGGVADSTHFFHTVMMWEEFMHCIVL